MPRARIVFEGLISFLRDEASREKWAAQDQQTMVALPINVPHHGPQHHHQPRLWWRAAMANGTDWFQRPIDITQCRVRFRWLDQSGQALARGPLAVDPRFDRYVPKYGWFYSTTTPSGQRPVVDRRFRKFANAPPAPATSQILLTEGTLTATPLVSKPKSGMPQDFPEEVRFRRAVHGSHAAGPVYLAQACVLEMANPDAESLQVTIEPQYGETTTQHVLYPVREASGSGDPVSIELMVQNFSAPRQAPVLYGIHFKHFFDLLEQGRDWLEQNGTELGHVPQDEAAEDELVHGKFPYPVIRASASGASAGHDVGSGPICPPMDDE